METPLRPVVVFQGNSDLEAQIARDSLAAAMIPVLHLPSLSTGIFGMRSNVNVAVPEEYAEQAQTLADSAPEVPESFQTPDGSANHEPLHKGS